MTNSSPLGYFDINTLTLRKQNARTHSPEQMTYLKAAITRFDTVAPLLIDGNLQIIAGEARYLAAKELGLKLLPALQVTHLGDTEKRALADNKVAEHGGWDLEILKRELIVITQPEIHIEAQDIGFADAEIDLVIGMDEDPAAEVEIIPPPPTDPVSVRGDVWTLDKHRLMCGSALDVETLSILTQGLQIDVVVTDPQYNAPIQGFVGGKGKHKHREFAQASGELSPAEFATWTQNAFTVSSAHLKDGGLFYSFIDWRGIPVISEVGRKVIGEVLNIAVWVKPNGGMGSFYRSRHELCAIFHKGSGPYCNNIELGRHGRNRTNVWEYAGQSSFGKDRDETLGLHPTVKPTVMIADILKDCTRRREIVLDPFVGSGTIFLAAEQTGRVAFGLEIDPAYVDVAVGRWQALTGKSAVHATTGESFEAVAERRRNEAYDEDPGDRTAGPHPVAPLPDTPMPDTPPSVGGNPLDEGAA